MSNSFVRDTLRAFGVVARSPGRRLESRSGAGVQPVVTAGGDDAYAKLTPGGSAAANRELRFYRELAPIAPVRTPVLLDHVDSDDGVGLLLAATGESLDVREWTAGMWSVLGRDLAALHTMPVPGQDWNLPGELAEAIADPDLPVIRAFWGSALDVVLSDVPRLTAAMSGPPPVFIHGDCHTENITQAGGTLVFCDWQQAGIGRPSTDLAFLSVRATPAGVTVPPALLDAYSAKGAPSAKDAPLLRRAVLAEEIAILTFLWPHYAAYNNPVGIARIRARAAALAADWTGTAR